MPGAMLVVVTHLDKATWDPAVPWGRYLSSWNAPAPGLRWPPVFIKRRAPPQQLALRRPPMVRKDLVVLVGAAGKEVARLSYAPDGAN